MTGSPVDILAAALRARCILTEPDGYYVPLADGGIGWWSHG